MNNAPLRVVLDCDTANEVDDQFAIAYALGSPALDVRGIISVHDTYIHGARSVEIYHEEAEKVVALCGKRGIVPCLRGGVGPMERRDTPVRSEGLDFLIAEARNAPITILATGPITDVASLLLVAPELHTRIRVVWMGGFGDTETFRHHRFHDLNGRADICGWRNVMETPVPLLLLPGWPALANLVVPYRAYAEELRAMGRPIATYLGDILAAWGALHGTDITGQPRETKILWDVANVAALTVPDAVTVVSRPAPLLDAAAAHDFTHSGRPIDVLINLDCSAIVADMTAALLRHPTTVG